MRLSRHGITLAPPASMGRPNGCVAGRDVSALPRPDRPVTAVVRAHLGGRRVPGPTGALSSGSPGRAVTGIVAAGYQMIGAFDGMFGW